MLTHEGLKHQHKLVEPAKYIYCFIYSSEPQPLKFSRIL